MLQARVQNDNIHVRIFDSVSSPHITDDLLLKDDVLKQEAEKRVSNNPATLKRVYVSRLSVDYAIIERVRFEIGRKIAFEQESKNHCFEAV